MYVLLWLISRIDINLFLFNITQESIDIWSIDGFSLADVEKLSNSVEYNTNMYDPVRDAAASRNTPQGESSSGGNNQGPSNPQPNQGSGGNFDTNNPVDQRTDTDKLADHVRSFQGTGVRGADGTLSNANITLTAHASNPNRNIEMSRIAAEVRRVRPDLFNSSQFSQTKISPYFVSQLDALKLNFSQ